MLVDVHRFLAAIHIARPLGLDPASSPIVDARLEDGSRVAICVPPASPTVAITVRRFGKRAFSAEDLVAQGALPEDVRAEAERVLHSRRNILVSGGTGSGKTTLLNALIELLPDDERIVAIEDTLELRIERSNCVRFEARGLQEGAVTIRDLVRHALRHRPDHIVVGEVRRREGCGPAAGTQYRTRRVADHRTRQQRQERPIEDRQLRHAGRAGSFPGKSPVEGWWRVSAFRGGSRFCQGLRCERKPLAHSAGLAGGSPQARIFRMKASSSLPYCPVVERVSFS